MGQVAIGRVIAGGLLAGLIINASQFVFNMFVVGPQLDEAMKAMNLPPIGGQAIGVFVVLCFGIGIVAVWLYAAVRPRFGPGVATAVKSTRQTLSPDWAWVAPAFQDVGATERTT